MLIQDWEQVCLSRCGLNAHNSNACMLQLHTIFLTGSLRSHPTTQETVRAFSSVLAGVLVPFASKIIACSKVSIRYVIQLPLKPMKGAPTPHTHTHTRTHHPHIHTHTQTNMHRRTCTRTRTLSECEKADANCS